jgi:sulfur-carrier protein adenylyltransferase/sulfurtransferase
MKTVTVTQLKAMQEAKEDFQLIDVREQYEYDEVNMNAQLIPMGELMERIDEIEKEKKVVIHCRSGARSANVISYLESQGFDNLYNLEGGILAWVAEQ